ncbi:MAG: DUF4143 domain-containing protein [Candidatus Muiribacteriota bacterium]
MPLTRPEYRERLIDKKVCDYLKIFGAVNIEGPKWCGKTWTSLNHAESVVYIGNPENNFQNRAMAELNPVLVLDGKFPRLIDEWQEVPELWDAVRFQVDKDGLKGKFILTGSATPQHKGILHSGTGRIGRLKMRTMSLFESGDSSGKISLKEIFYNKIEPVYVEGNTLENLINLTIRGGWPGSLGLDINLSQELSVAYLKNVIEDDMYKLDGIKRDYKKVKLFLKSLARNESTVVSNRTLKNDLMEHEGENIDVNTIADYLNIFNRLFLIEDQPAYSPNIRSSIRVGKSPKRHFIDPSLAIAALGANYNMLYNDLNTFGLLFESLCIRDLKCYAEVDGGKVFHYRDEKGREADAIVELNNGKWGVFEIKLGANQIDDAAKKLLELNKFFIENKKSEPPSVLGVITGIGNMAYTREDGVSVIPITALKN